MSCPEHEAFTPGCQQCVDRFRAQQRSPPLDENGLPDPWAHCPHGRDPATRCSICFPDPDCPSCASLREELEAARAEVGEYRVTLWNERAEARAARQELRDEVQRLFMALHMAECADRGNCTIPGCYSDGDPHAEECPFYGWREGLHPHAPDTYLGERDTLRAESAALRAEVERLKEIILGVVFESETRGEIVFAYEKEHHDACGDAPCPCGICARARAALSTKGTGNE